jgi:hypothetical protein
MHAPDLLPEYKFQVVEDADYNDTITYLTDPSNIYVPSEISGGEGGGLCAGGFLVFATDGKRTWNFKPVLQNDGVTLQGMGEYRLYDTDQRGSGQ